MYGTNQFWEIKRSQRSNPLDKVVTQMQFQPDHQVSHLRLRSRRVEAPRTARQCWTCWWPQLKLVHFQATKNNDFLQCAQHSLPRAWKLNVSTFGLWPESSWGSNPGQKPVTDTAITTLSQPKTSESHSNYKWVCSNNCRSWCILHKRNVLLLQSQAT